MKVIELPVKDLIPYVNNSRTHDDEQVAQIAASIKEYGWTNPILVDEQHVIIAGHGRLSAARKLKMETVPCIQIDNLTDARRRALVIADNKLAMNASWDYDMLKAELQSLNDEAFDMSLLGFSPDELKNIMYDDVDDAPPDEFKGDASNKWQLLIEYDNENDLQNAYDEFMERGLQCKIIQ